MLCKRLLVLSIAAIWVDVPAAAENTKEVKFDGAISGVVLTENGVPAAGFWVCTQVRSRESGLMHTSTTCPAKTNEAGQFTIEHIKTGTYEVLAINEVEGYSMPSQTPGVSVTISEDSPRPQVTVTLARRGAVVVANFTDRDTGKRIHGVDFWYTGVDCEATGSASEAEEYILSIPIDCDVVLVARAKGYKGWVYTDEVDSSRPVLRLGAGDKKIFDLHLEPLP